MVNHGVAVFGDSIANGLGVTGGSYGAILASELGLELLDYSGSAQMITESVIKFSRNPSAPSVSIIAHGVTEAIVRPDPALLKYLPGRWRRIGWMDPRPYYSSSKSKRFGQKIESAVRWRLKNCLLRIGSRQQLVTIKEYTDGLTILIQSLKAAGSRVIVLGPPDIDEKYFPFSQESLIRYEKESKSLSAEHVSLHGVLNPWEDYFPDHFHPNAQGHLRIAHLLRAAIVKTA